VTVKTLVASDFPALRDLLVEQRTFFGLDVRELPDLASSKNLQRLFVRYLAMPEDTLIYGYFNDELLGMITLDLFPKLELWVIKLVMIQEQLKGTSHEASAMLLTHATEAAEKLGYVKHLTMVPAKYYKNNLNRWHHVEARRRYKVTILEEVPAGERSSVPLHRSLFYSGQVYPIDTMIRLFELR